MDDGKVSVRYARALLSQATDEQCAREVYEGLQRLEAGYVTAISEFNEVLSNPMIGGNEKLQLLRVAIGEPVHPCLDHFLEFLILKKRESKILWIALKYQEMYRKANRIVRADVTTTVEPTDEVLNRVREFVEQHLHCSADLHTKVDPTLIGGFMLDIDNTRMDMSVKGRLEKLKNTL